MDVRKLKTIILNGDLEYKIYMFQLKDLWS